MTFFSKLAVFFSILACALPAIAQRADAEAPAYSKVVIENCHEDRVDLRIWVSDRGGAWRDRGAWKNHGLLESQWSGSDCPATGSPKTIELTSGAKWVVKALDSRCGSKPPVDSLPRCHILTTKVLKGDPASTNVYKVRIGSGSQGASD